MNEREILEKIMESAQDLRVPETLKPEQIKKQLEGLKLMKQLTDQLLPGRGSSGMSMLLLWRCWTGLSSAVCPPADL